MCRPASLRDTSFRTVLLAPLVALAITILLIGTGAGLAQSSVRPPDSATQGATSPTDGIVPGDALGNTSDSEVWRAVRRGTAGTVSIPNDNAGVLVQSAGENWRLIRNGPFYDYLGLAMVATLVLLALFFAIRGPMKVEAGESGIRIRRFSYIERTGHWLTAMSFIVLGLSGLNVSFGREYLMPLIGKEAFGPLSLFLKMTHNYVAFAFMLGLVMTFVMWVLENLPNRYDLIWLAKGGGMFSNTHAPAKKFNAGQKAVFWLVMLGGLSLSVSGWAMLYPFHYHFFTDTFQALGSIGIDVPAMLGIASPPYSFIQEQQFNALWHAVVAIAMICMIFAHIYLGTIGMQGAFSAMGSGDVDLNWARDHHDKWVEELEEEDKLPETAGHPQPAE